MGNRLGIVCVITLLAACKAKDKEAKPVGEAATDGGGAAVAAKDGGTAKVAARDGGGAAATRDGGVAAKRVPMVERAAVDAAMAAWLETQNAGKFDAYAAFYAEGFKGVRRSGKQTAHLDRKKWLGERKKMFGKPMLVAMTGVEVKLGPGKATVEFDQEWSSGKYHDVGPKIIELVVDGKDLKFIREEMLKSKIVKPAKPVDSTGLPPVLPVLDKNLVVLAVAEATWAKGDAKLLGGEIPERDPECDDDPPDYEEDHERYWECEASDPDRGYDSFVASAPVDLAALPKNLAAWKDAELRLGGVGAGCTAKVARLELHAERRVTFSEVTGGADDDDGIAAAVMKDGAPVLVAVLAGGCEAHWAQQASATPAVAWTLAQAPAALDTIINDRLKVDVPDDRYGVAVQLLTGPDGKAFAIGSFEPNECEPQVWIHVLYALDGSKVTGDLLLEGDSGSLLGAVDGDGDGWPELVFDNGIAVRDPDTGDYEHLVMIDFPDEIFAECGE